MKIYLAGPDVFLPDAIEIGRLKVDICARHGLTGLPSTPPPKTPRWGYFAPIKP
jgi:nucleoside 2-deoxyribosyltransferase